MIEPEILNFKDDGITPNNRFPVIIYRNVFKHTGIKSASSFKAVFAANNWTNNWKDIIMTQNHYHSTTHEVIGIDRGEVDLKLGGKYGSVVTVKAGDVILIPAGVGHYSLDNQKSYEAIGGYPNGAKWDMVFDEKDKHLVSVDRIRQLPIPKKDPVFGQDGALFQYWK